MVRIVLTHGRGLRARNEDKLRGKFVRHMRQGLEDIGYERLDDHDISFIYYGDVLERPETPAEVVPAAESPESPLAARRFRFDVDVERLSSHLAQAAGTDPRVCTLVEERTSRQPIAAEDTEASERRHVVESALEDRTAQLLDDPGELRSVLERQFGSDLDDDEALRRDVQELDERIGENPREAAAHKLAGDEAMDDSDRIDAVLRGWIVEPATDAVAGLRALSQVMRDYGVDLRSRLSDWQRVVFQEMLTRFEGTDFGQQWMTAFDVIAFIANNSILDGLYIMHRMSDVENYFRDDTIREDVRELFADVLRNHDEPTILIAHSLGTVIAYDALRAYADLDVSGLVTLGSPLSIGHFRTNLARTGESGDNLPVPEMLAKWVNVYSEMDPLTLGRGIQRYFEGGGPNGRGPVDREAENTGYLDAHSPDQYLRSTETAKAIIAMIAQGTVRASAARS